jgi:5'-deoxynucleotidase YfbR-like HD superfamily hydrolase
MLALLVSEYEKFNKLKVLELLLAHDLMEAVTGDLVTTTLPESKSPQATMT